MKRILLTLLAIFIVFGLFAVVGYSGYRLGYAQGAQGVQGTDDGDMPRFRPFDEFGPHRMPRHDFGFGRGFPRGFGVFPFWGFSFYSLFGLLFWLAALALTIWFVYWLFTRSGWRLTRQTTTTTTTTESSPPPAENE